MKKIVIVGGGVAGLELATQLGNKLGKKHKAQITLIDQNPIHFWKPMLHELATGFVNEVMDGISYLAHAKNNYFQFQVGSLKSIDREKKLLYLQKIQNTQQETVVPERKIKYDILVIALGSISNDFNTMGVKNHCMFLDSMKQAKNFHHKLLELLLKNSTQEVNKKVTVAIVGGGATGVELAAEVHNAVEILESYNALHSVKKNILNVIIIEAGKKILPNLPENIANAALIELKKIGITVVHNTTISRVEKNTLYTQRKEKIKADLIVWAAGIKIPNFMKNIGNLETNKINQLVVQQTLQSTLDNDIYAIGDCASCSIKNSSSFVPPRAQSAHQMAYHAFKNIILQVNGQKLQPYVYKDYGSLVSLSKFTAVGFLGSKNKFLSVEGKIAKLMYVSLYRMHQIALHGYIKTGLMILVDAVNKVIRPRLKLH